MPFIHEGIQLYGIEEIIQANDLVLLDTCFFGKFDMNFKRKNLSEELFDAKTPVELAALTGRIRKNIEDWKEILELNESYQKFRMTSDVLTEYNDLLRHIDEIIKYHTSKCSKRNIRDTGTYKRPKFKRNKRQINLSNRQKEKHKMRITDSDDDELLEMSRESIELVKELHGLGHSLMKQIPLFEDRTFPVYRRGTASETDYKLVSALFSYLKEYPENQAAIITSDSDIRGVYVNTLSRLTDQEQIDFGTHSNVYSLRAPDGASRLMYTNRNTTPIIFPADIFYRAGIRKTKFYEVNGEGKKLMGLIDEANPNLMYLVVRQRGNDELAFARVDGGNIVFTDQVAYLKRKTSSEEVVVIHTKSIEPIEHFALNRYTLTTSGILTETSS